MARNYARIGTTIWDDPDFIALPGLAQRCYLFLLSQKDMSLTGVLVRRSKWTRSCDDYKTLDDDLAVLVDRGFVLVDDDTDEVLVRTFMRHDGVLSNEKLRKGARARVGAIHSPRLRAVVEQQLDESDGVSGALSHDPSDAPSHGVPDAPGTSKPSSSDPASASSVVSEIHSPPPDDELSEEGERMLAEAAEWIARWELDAARGRGVVVGHQTRWMETAASRAKAEHRAATARHLDSFTITDARMLAEVLVGRRRLTLADRKAS